VRLDRPGLQSPSGSLSAPVSSSTNTSTGSQNVGKMVFSATQPAQSVGQSAEGFIGAAQGLGKAAVNIVENLPVVGLVAKPVIGAIGAVADATVGNVVGAVAKSPLGDAIGTGTNFVAGAALAPLDLALKAVMAPSMWVQQRVAEARITTTLAGRSDLVTKLFGNAPDSVVNEIRNGKEVNQVAEEMVSQFGVGPSKMGAFSEDAVTNLAWTIILDPFNLFGDIIFKPITMGAKAAQLSAVGTRGLLRLSLDLKAEAKALSALGEAGTKLGKIRLAEAAARKADARFMEKWGWTGKYYSATFGKVKNPLTKVFGEKIGKTITQAYFRVVGTEEIGTSLDRLSAKFGSRKVDEAVGHAAVTLKNATATATADAVVASRRNIFEATAQNLIKDLHGLVAEGADSAVILAHNLSDGVTVRDLLKASGMVDSDIAKVAEIVSSKFNPSLRTFVSNTDVQDTLNLITGAFLKTDIKTQPELYLRIASYLGKSNLNNSVDAAVALLTSQKLELKRFADVPELGIKYLTEMLQHTFELTPESAAQFATEEFTRLAGNSRELNNILEFYRAASFGKSMRTIADLRNGFPKTFAEIPETLARRDNIAKTFFAGLEPEQGLAAATVFDSIGAVAAHNEGISINDWYSKYVFGLTGKIEDDAINIVEELNKTQNEINLLLQDKNAEQILENIKLIKPTQRMVDAGLGGQLPVEVIDFGDRVPFALPGGLGALDDPAPYNFIDEAIIQSQPANKIPGDVRVKIYKKIWANKVTDPADHVAIVNRMVFALLSANTDFISNSAMFALMRVQTADDLAKIAVDWGTAARSEMSAMELGTRYREQFFGPGVKRMATTEGGTTSIAVNDENIGRAIRSFVYANDNPSWFTIRAGETPEEFATRMTLLPGAAQKVGTFAAEMVNPALMSRGAIDLHMTTLVYEFAGWADPTNAVFQELLSDLRSVRGGESFIKKMEEQISIANEAARASGKKAKLSGVSSSGHNVERGVKNWGKYVPQNIVDASEELPAYMRNKKQNFEVFENSPTEVMQKWVERIAAKRSAEFPGLENLSGAQKQWFLWDLQRGNIEPHSLINTGTERMAKGDAKQIADAHSALTKASPKGQPFTGVDPKIIAEFYARRGEEILGVTKFAEDGRATIKLFEGADITTAIHEIGHFARRQLNPTDHEFVLRNYSDGGKWTVKSEERFAEDFVNYLYTGKAPVSNLVDTFGKIRDIISRLWSDVSGSETIKIQPQMKEVFDRLFIANGPSLTEPTADFWSRVTLVSNRTMTQGIRNDIVDLVNQKLGRTDGASKPVSLEEAIGRTDDALRLQQGFGPDGGATFNPLRGTSRSPNDGRGGFAVTFKPETPYTGARRMQILTDPREKARVVKEFIRTNEGLLRGDQMYIGVYDNVDTGELFIEVSRVWDNAQQAIESGVKNNQESIFAFNNDKALMYLDTEKGRIALAKKNAKLASDGQPQLTFVKSADQIPNLESLLPKKYSDQEIDKLLEKVAGDAILKYDDLARIFWNKNEKASPSEVIQYIIDHPEIATRELSDLEKNALPDAFKAREAEILNAGYRYGIAPQNGYLERTAMVRDAFGVDRIQQVISPYNDMLDSVAIDALDAQIAGVAKRPTLLDRFVDKMTRQYGSDVTRNNYVERLTTDLMNKSGASQKDVLTIVARVGNLASRKETTVKGLWFEKDQVQQIFKDVLGEAKYLKYAETNDPFTDIVRAAAGDLGVIGLAPGFSGRVKAWKPIMGVITDRAYPVARFGKLNPIFFNWLEPIETKMMKLVLDIKGEITNEALKDRESTILRRMFTDNRSANLEIAEGLFYDQQKNATATLLAANAAPELRDNIGRVIRTQNLIKDGKWAVMNPQEYKRIARDMTASQLAVRQYTALLEKVAPDAWKAMQELGLTDAQAIVQRMLEDYMIQSSPEAMARALAGQANDTIGLWVKTLSAEGMTVSQSQEIAAAAYGVFQDAMVRGTRTADKYQYFSQYRSWFERSINHPFLGVYPYSYMTQKAIPSMLKLMFAPKILGTTRPGLGLITYMRFKELLASDTSADQNFLTEIAKNRAIWYAINIMLPATPENMGFSLPSYLRRGILQPAQNNQPLDLATLSKTPTYVGETIMRGTFLGQGASIMQALGAFGGSVDNQIQDVAPQIQTEVNRFFNP